jgi:hypothetical protein
MKKIAIPAILAATVLIAGLFAFMPIEKASTVHSTITGGSVFQVTSNTFALPAANGGTGTLTITAPAATDIIVYSVACNLSAPDNDAATIAVTNNGINLGTLTNVPVLAAGTANFEVVLGAPIAVNSGTTMTVVHTDADGATDTDGNMTCRVFFTGNTATGVTAVIA